MDVAKLTALVLGSGENLEKRMGVVNAPGPRLPLCLILTTAGTGPRLPLFQLSSWMVMKRGVLRQIILPDFAVLDQFNLRLARGEITMPPELINGACNLYLCIKK